MVHSYGTQDHMLLVLNYAAAAAAAAAVCFNTIYLFPLEFVRAGGGRGKAFMERFCCTSSRNDFVDYRRAIRKFEGHLSTVRESIVGGSWNQDFK